MAEDTAEQLEIEMDGVIETDPQDVHKKPDPESDVEGLMGDAHRDGKTPDPDPKDDENEFEQAPVTERPDYLLEQHWDEKKGEINTEALAKSYKDLRKEFNKVKKEGVKDPKAPDTAEAYLTDFKSPTEFKDQEGVTHELDRIGEIAADDPGLTAAAGACKRHNVSKEAFEDIVISYLGAANELMPEPFNREAELESLGGEEKALPVISTNQKWLIHLHKTGVLNEDEYNLYLGLGRSALGIQALNKIRVNSGEKPIPIGATVSTGAKTPDELAAMMEDDRYRAETPAGEAYRAEVDAEYKKTFPG